VIVAVKLDRVFRSTIDALKTMEHLKARGIDVILADLGSEPVTSNGVGKLVFGLMAMFADFERERIGERMEDGRLGKRQKGGFLGGQPPFGFRVEGEGRQAKLVPDLVEQHLVKTVVMLARRHAPSSIIKILKEQNIKGRNNQPISYMQIKRILSHQKKLRASNATATAA
jgi:DNA invertase Pin-like site-specific DNA recombinase